MLSVRDSNIIKGASIILFILLSSVIFMQQAACAQDNGLSVDMNRFTFVELGQAAPFGGILLEPTALAQILADSDFAIKQMELKHKYNALELEALWSTKEKMLKSSLESQGKVCDDRLKIKEREIDKLTNIAIKRKNKAWVNVLWGAGGLVTGVLITVGTTYLVLEAVGQ